MNCDDTVDWPKALVDAAIHSFSPPANSDADAADIDWQSLLLFFPHCIRTVVSSALRLCADDPNPEWPDSVLKTIGRLDLCAAVMGGGGILVSAADDSHSASPEDISSSDGLAAIEKSSYLRFTADNRMHEVCRMLCSSKSLYLKLEKAPEVSDLDHRGKLQQRLMVYCRRSLACPVGRGMLTMSSLEPLIAEALPMPPLSLVGRVAPTNTSLALDISTQPDLTLWPDFHNGVAAVLRVGSVAKEQFSSARSKTKASHNYSSKQPKVTRNWIVYNRTASQRKPGGECSHAGAYNKFIYG